ncbi:YgaP family membrane protein [Croceibacterium aestuarii]|uniref:YgaP family membrane protein n=1 Tax=Croceibacterium aestuarii TaxID=3064139 RepID=UPI00272DED65|nr:DUF2892 domain-containing protein [Croceibacterium sp. D39]
MTTNMGKFDRILRIAVAIALVVLIATGALHGTLGILAGVVAAVFLVTSLVGFCPAYRLVGIDTCGKN